MKQIFTDELTATQAAQIGPARFVLIKETKLAKEIIAFGDDPIAVSNANKPFTREPRIRGGAVEFVNVVDDNGTTVELNERDVWPGCELYRVDVRDGAVSL